MGERAGIAVTTFLVAIMAALAASAGEAPAPSRQLSGVFAPDPEGVWRTITQTEATSDCIGEPVTPMCAIDSWIACGTRLEVKLCDIAGGEPQKGLRFVSTPSPRSYVNYRVVSVRRAEVKDITAVPVYNKKQKRKIGDLLIGVIEQGCVGSKEYCVTDGMPTTYTLRRSRKQWRIIDLYTPRY